MSSTDAASTSSAPKTVARGGRRRLAATAALLAAGLLAGTAGTATAAPAATRAGGPTRVTTGLGGAQPDGAAWAEGLSAGGRYAVIGADATNLVPGDTNGAEDIYLRDRWTGRTERLTTGDPKREVPELNSYLASISWDGRYVAFASSRTDLVAGPVNQLANVYLLDRWNGTTRLVTRAAEGTPADRPSAAPVISGDGSRVGFVSKATNLLPPEEGGGGEGDRTADVASSAAASAASGASASADDHVPGRPARRESSPAGAATGARAEITKPRHYPFYVHDVATGQLKGGSVDETGQLLGSSNGAFSPDGRYAVFAVPVPNTPDGSGWERHFEILVRDLRQGTVRRLPAGLPGTVTTGSSYSAVMSAGNRWVYFVSEAENLVPGDTNLVDDIFRHDLWTGRTERLNVSADGAQTTGYSSDPLVDALGTTLLFTSEDGTLVPGDTNTAIDAFTRRLPLF
ncbi:TolB family protein [Kitasatospora purpeofusca]|uniref:TolB family protein n=1 Tax=Kitasatospora purpeofusca TaxID=67352 RepID=UPI0022555E70|nr:hypothetical protein [Kitasatospora purpeofusca]MCX4758962.1 hypothetical protein [Kitasatospora purpeofusca]WSR30618.1 hypothetical protein OG715_06355 [Kitasatospora purpeofusca]